MRTHIASLADALVSASVMLAAPISCASVASADPSQQDQFVALLAQLQIPATDNVPGLVYRAHELCGKLDRGTPFQAVVDEVTNTSYQDNPSLHLVPDRVTRTAVRFITASVDVYCPSHQDQLPPP